MKIANLFNQSRLDSYLTYLANQQLSPASIKRKQSSLSTFSKFLVKKGLVKQTNPSIPIPQSQSPLPPKSFLNRYLLFASLAILLSGLVYGIYYQTVLKAKQDLAYSTANAPIRPGRQLSFQGRLTDSSSNPIISSTGVIFRFFNVGATGVGTSLYTSEVGNSQTVTPDENGIFSVIIGKTHGTEIPSSVFSENAEVWLEITAGGETMNPRQQISTVAYALNAETLQGLAIGTSGMGYKNTVAVFDNVGNINLGETSPAIKSNSGTFGIIGQALLIGTSDGSGGDIEINPDANGIIKFTTEGNIPSGTGGLISATNGGNLNSGNLFYGSVGDDDRGYNFLQFQNYDIGDTTTLITRFSVGASGNFFASGNGDVGGTLTSANSIISNLTANQLIVGGGSNPITPISAGIAGQLLQSTGIGTTPVWIAAASVGTSYGATNGLSIISTNIGLGGTLTQNTRLNIGNTEVMYFDYASGNVGIGTTGPSEKLQVAGAIRVTGASAGFAANVLQLDHQGAGQARIISYGADASTRGKIIFHQARSDNSAAQDAMVIDTAGNIGIGTTGPSGKLQVVGQLWAGANAKSLITDDGTRAMFTTPSDSIPLFLGIDQNTTRGININTSGNIGIGTTNPTYTLQIGGTGSLGVGGTINFTGLAIGTTGTGTTAVFIDSSGNLYKNKLGALAFADTTISTYNWVANATSPQTISAGTTLSFTGTNGITSTSVGTTQITFKLGGALTEATRLNIGATEVMYFSTAGLVGIGTTGPASLLTVNGNAEIQTGGYLRLRPTNNAYNYDLQATGNDLQILAGASPVTYITNVGSVGIGGTAAATAPLLYVQSTGNVGIGTTAPTHKLHVEGSIISRATIPALGLYTDSASGTEDGFDFITNTANLLQIREVTAGSALTRMAIDTSGNVGIGTTNPLYPLQVNGAVVATKLGVGGTDTNAFYVSGSSNLSGNVGIGGTLTLSASTVVGSGTTALFIDPSTNIVTRRALGDLAFQNNATLGWVASNGATNVTVGTGTTITFIGGTDVSVINIGNTFQFHNTSTLQTVTNRGASTTNQLTISYSGAPFVLSSGNTATVTNLSADLLDGQHATAFVGVGATGLFVKDTGDTMTGNLQFTAAGIELNRVGSTTHGISWYSPTYSSWVDYMGQAAQTGLGPHTGADALTAPTGTLFSWLTALVLLATVANVCRDRLRIGLLLAVLAASGVASVTRCTMQKSVEFAETWQEYEKGKVEFWTRQNVALDDPRVTLYERRIKAAEASGFLAMSNTEASFLALAGFALLGLRGLVARKRWASGFLLAPAVLVFAAILLTGSKGAMLATVAGVLTWLVLSRVQERFRRRWHLLFVSAWVGLAGLASFTVIYGVRMGGLPTDSLRFRWNYWQVTRNVIAQHLLTGVGALNFDNAYLALKPVHFPEEIVDPHNFVLSIVAQWGLVGGIGLLALCVGFTYAITRMWGQREPTDAPPPVFGPQARYDGTSWVVAVSIGFVLLRLWLMRGWLGEQDGPAYMFFDIGLYGLVWIVVFAGLNWLIRGGWTGDIDACQVACVTGVLAFVLHNLIDCAVFYPGALLPFAAMAGLLPVNRHVLGDRDPLLKTKRIWAFVFLAAGSAAFAVLVVVPVTSANALLSHARFDPLPSEDRTKLLQAAVDADPLDPTAPSELAMSLVAAGELRSALDALSEAVARDPERIAGYRQRAELAERLFQQSGSLADLQLAMGNARKAVSMYPNSPDDHAWLADILVRAGFADSPDGLPEVLKHYRRALDLDNARSSGEIRRWSLQRRQELQARMQQLAQRATSQPATSPAVVRSQPATHPR